MISYPNSEQCSNRHTLLRAAPQATLIVPWIVEGESESIRCDVSDSISKRERGLGVADSQFVLPPFMTVRWWPTELKTHLSKRFLNILWILNIEMETSSLPAFLIGCLTVDDCYLHIGADVVMDREPKVTTYFDQNYGGPVGASLNHILPKIEGVHGSREVQEKYRRGEQRKTRRSWLREKNWGN